jgi:hypothetical protein
VIDALAGRVFVGATTQPQTVTLPSVDLLLQDLETLAADWERLAAHLGALPGINAGARAWQLRDDARQLRTTIARQLRNPR